MSNEASRWWFCSLVYTVLVIVMIWARYGGH